MNNALNTSSRNQGMTRLAPKILNLKDSDRLNRVENSDVNFDRAIELFTEMEAPKQVEKRKIQNWLLNTSQALDLEEWC